MFIVHNIFFLLILSFLVCSTSSAIEYKHEGKLGYLVEGLNYVKQKDTKLAFGLWIQELANNESTDLHVEYYKDPSKHKEDYINFKFSYMTMNTYFFLKNREVLTNNSREYWTIQKGEELYEEYVVLVREESGINQIKDLKGVHLLSREDDYIGRMVLDYMFLDSFQKSVDEYISKMYLTKKDSESILKVYFKKADACIVPSYALDIVAELNPDVGRKLRVLYKTPKIFVPMIGAFHKKTDPELMKIFYRNVVRLDKTARGRSILDLYKMKKMFIIELKLLEPIIQYYERYISLKKRYTRNEE